MKKPKTVDEAGGYRSEAIKDNVPPELHEATDNALGFVTEQAKANPLLALLIAAIVGYVIAQFVGR